MKFLALLLVCAYAKLGLEKLDVDDAFKQWRKLYKDPYADRDAFGYNHAIVRYHNSQNYTYTLALNKFAALSNDAFVKMMNGYAGKPLKTGVTFVKPSLKANPAQVDWRTQGLVNPVKNQEQCGSCWAFSAVVGLEGQVAKVGGNLQSLSEQDFVDCVKNVAIDGQSCCNGCGGGLMDFAFKFMVSSENGVDALEKSYPYTAANGNCDFSSKEKMTGAKVTGYTDIKQTENDLEDAVASVGPISVAVNASPIAWQLYHGGVLNPMFGCDPSKLDHGVAVVGYNKDTWTIRNSWGASWGENGYANLKRGDGTGLGTCGVASAATYPNVVKN